jgi:uncharacterized protein
MLRAVPVNSFLNSFSKRDASPMGLHRYCVADETFSLNPETMEVVSEGPSDSVISVGLLNYTEGDAQSIEIPKAVAAISLNVVQKCNFDCTYCYADQGTYGKKGSMCFGTARQSIDWLVDQVGDSRELSVTFFGGEPLLEFALIKQIVNYANEKQLNRTFIFRYSITTNGSLIDDLVIEFFKANNFWVNISMDGPVDLQNLQRPLINGKGSAGAVHYRVKRLIDAYADVSCRATITDEANRDRVQQFLESFGFKNITISLASNPLSRSTQRYPLPCPASIEVYRSEIDRDILDHFLELIRRRDSHSLKSTKLPSHLYKPIYAFMTKNKKNSFCGAGLSYVGISSEGQAYLCHRFVGHEKFSLGHVASAPALKALVTLREEFSASEENSKCVACFARNLCGGGCYHNNLGKTGSPFEQSEEECVKVRASVELAGRFVANLTEEDKGYLLSQNVIATKFCPLDL